jgi:hypothetical protein
VLFARGSRRCLILIAGGDIQGSIQIFGSAARKVAAAPHTPTARVGEFYGQFRAAVAASSRSHAVLVLRCLLPRASARQSGFTLVLQSEALSVDVDDDRMMEDPIEHRHGEHTLAGEGRSQLPKVGFNDPNTRYVEESRAQPRSRARPRRLRSTEARSVTAACRELKDVQDRHLRCVRR